MSEIEILACVLARAFHNEPRFTYVLPDDRTRRDVLPSFFRVAIRVGQLYGQIYTTSMIDGGALWICPGREFTFSRMVRTGTLAIPFKVGWTKGTGVSTDSLSAVGIFGCAQPFSPCSSRGFCMFQSVLPGSNLPFTTRRRQRLCIADE